jgi:hypothetical protein
LRRKIIMDVMNPTYQEVERALDLDLAKLTLTMVWARQNGYTVEPKRAGRYQGGHRAGGAIDQVHWLNRRAMPAGIGYLALRLSAGAGVLCRWDALLRRSVRRSATRWRFAHRAMRDKWSMAILSVTFGSEGRELIDLTLRRKRFYGGATGAATSIIGEA